MRTILLSIVALGSLSLFAGQGGNGGGVWVCQNKDNLGTIRKIELVDFYEAETRGDSIFLEINIKELPKLSEVKITGLKKGKRESLITDNKLTKGKVVNENLITTTRNAIIDPTIIHNP